MVVDIKILESKSDRQAFPPPSAPRPRTCIERKRNLAILRSYNQSQKKKNTKFKN